MRLTRSKLRRWEDVVHDLVLQKSRYIVHRRKTSPFIQIVDKQSKKRFSIAPIQAWENMPDVLRIHELILSIGNKPWPNQSIEKLLQVLEDPDSSVEEFNYQWEDVRTYALQHCLNSNKGIDPNVKCDLNNLVKSKPPFQWADIRCWVYEKKLEKKAFRNRLDSLAQIRLALTNKFGSEPDWLKREELMKLRELHRLAYKKENKFISNESHIRGIPTKDELEEYLTSLDKKFRLERWCIACQATYGLRNHELHHASIIKTTNTEEGLYKGHLYVPGEWRTKSFEHFVWPLYPSWIEKFNLMDDFDSMQNELRERVKINIVSAFDKSEQWIEGNPQDRGVCINNRTLGSWLTKRMKNYLPAFYGSVPDAEGLPDKKIEAQRITPYDLRHNWAIRHATDPTCAGITDEQAAKAMGHSLEVHRKNYQKWVSVTEARRQYMTAISFPKE